MAQTVQLTLGAQVTCTDGKCGLVHSLVVDPAGPSVTHLVVEPEHRIGLGRLVPIGLVGSSGAVVELSCDLAKFNSLPLAESTELVPELGAGYVFLRSAELQRPEVREVLPEGEAGLGSGTQVVATDGPVGVVAGLLTSAGDHRVISVLVSEERFPWGHKTLAIPIGAVATFDGGVQLNLATAEVERAAKNSSP